MRNNSAVLMSDFLPRELVDLIIDQLADDRISLRACSVVCSSWTARSRYYLYSDVLLNKRNSDDILSLPSPSAFSAAARRLMLEEKDAFPSGIELFPSVRSFYLTLSTAIPETITKIPLLFSKITTFELNQVAFDDFEDIVRLVCSLPCLETFTNFMCTWKHELNTPRVDLRLPNHLHTLNIISMRLHVFLGWFNTHETLPQISTVRFYGVAPPHVDSVGTALKRIGSSLQHLTLDLWDDGTTEVESDIIDLSENRNLLSFTLLNGWPKLLQELLLTYRHPALQRASLTIYEGKGNIPNLYLLNWAELDHLVAAPETAFHLAELVICVYAHRLISTVTRETVESQFLPLSGAKGLVKFVPERERASERRKSLCMTSPITRRSWGDRISAEEEGHYLNSGLLR